MPVKPAAGEVLEETKRTRILPTDDIERDSNRRWPPMWEFVDTLKPADWGTGDYQFTIYRGTKVQPASQKVWIGKFQEAMTPDVIQSRFGGGKYNVWLKCPPALSLRYNEDLEIEGPPKVQTEPISSAPVGNDATSQLIALFREEMRSMREEMRAARGGDLGLEAVKQAMALNGQVFTSAVPAVTAAINGGSGGHQASPMDEITKQFMQAAITKMLNPADPIENFSKMAQAMGTLGFKMGGGNPSGGLASELARGLMNALPQLAAHVGGIMDQYRRAEEAKANSVAMMRGLPAPITTQAAAPPPVAAPVSNVIEMPAAPADNPGGTEQSMSAEQLFNYVETKVVQLLMDQNLTPEEAANDALTFIDVTDKNLVDELIRNGEGGLRWAFSARPILKQIPAGPRLDAFIAEFVKNGRKVSMPVPPVPDPNIPPA